MSIYYSTEKKLDIFQCTNYITMGRKGELAIKCAIVERIPNLFIYDMKQGIRKSFHFKSNKIKSKADKNDPIWSNVLGILGH